jgi:hypothetical protein
MKKIVPGYEWAIVEIHIPMCTHQRRKSRYAKRPAW